MWPSNALVSCDQGIFKPGGEKGKVVHIWIYSKMKAVLILSVFMAQAYGQTAECNSPEPSVCADGEIR